MAIRIEGKEVNKKITLKRDVYFKALFGRKENKEFLIDFLESLLKIEIEDVEITEEVSLEKLSEREKGGRIDLQAILDDGTIVNIEMQVRNEHNIEKRSNIYAAKTISRHFFKGEKYKEARQVIMINILDYEIFGFEEYVSQTITVLEKHRDYKVENIINTYYIELPKFRRSKIDMEERLNQWLAFIDGKKGELVKMAEEKNEKIKKAKEFWDCLTGDAEARRMEELEEKWESDWNSEIDYAREEAAKEGMEKGLKEGRKKGMEEGIKEGEKNKQIEIARSLLKENMSFEFITKHTGLSEEEIKKLQLKENS